MDSALWAAREGSKRRSDVVKPPDGIRVEIYDQEYCMRGELDAEYIRKLARFLDDKMRSIAERTHTVDSLRVAILAALNIADEYHQLKTRYDAATERVNQKADEYSEVLDEVLKQAV
jgi:cell division protein ZapA